MMTTIQKDIALGQAINLVHAEWQRIGNIVREDTKKSFVERTEFVYKLILECKETIGGEHNGR